VPDSSRINNSLIDMDKTRFQGFHYKHETGVTAEIRSNRGTVEQKTGTTRPARFSPHGP
jgi:hypothetical protein